MYQDIPKESGGEDVELVEDVVPVELSTDIAKDATISDLDYLKMKMQSSQPLTEETPKEPQQAMKVNPGRLAILQEAGVVDPNAVSNTIQEEEPVVPRDVDVRETIVDDEPAKEEAPSPDLIAETSRIMVRNLPYSCTYEDLQELFKSYGPITEASNSSCFNC